MLNKDFNTDTILSQGAFNGQLMNPKETQANHAASKKQKIIKRMSGDSGIPRTYYSSQTTFLINQHLKSAPTLTRLPDI